MKRKIAALSATVLSIALIFTACGSGNNATDEAQNKGTGAEVTQQSKVEEKVKEEVKEAVEEVKEEVKEEVEKVKEELKEETAEAGEEVKEEIEEIEEEVQEEVQQAKEEEKEEAKEEKEEPDGDDAGENGSSPYAWLGMPEMPKCDYMDALASYHYIETYDNYAMGLKIEETNAVDGINTYKENKNTRVYSIDGHAVSVNDSAKVYSEMEMGDAEAAKKSLEEAMASGENVFGRHFVGTGSEAIPLYSDEGDTAEYEYYEYDYPEGEEYSYSTIERYYMKDGDVFAIYTKVIVGDAGLETETTKVIKSVSTEIPEGTFELPDLTGYELFEL